MLQTHIVIIIAVNLLLQECLRPTVLTAGASPTVDADRPTTSACLENTDSSTTIATQSTGSFASATAAAPTAVPPPMDAALATDKAMKDLCNDKQQMSADSVADQFASTSVDDAQADAGNVAANGSTNGDGDAQSDVTSGANVPLVDPPPVSPEDQARQKRK